MTAITYPTRTDEAIGRFAILSRATLHLSIAAAIFVVAYAGLRFTNLVLGEYARLDQPQPPAFTLPPEPLHPRKPKPDTVRKP